MPLTDDHQLVSWDDHTVTFGQQARATLLRHGDQILAEVPAT